MDTMEGISSYKSFNATLAEFLGDLSATFDEFPEIGNAKNALDLIISSNEESPMPLEKFHEMFSGHFDLALSQNRQLFDQVRLPLMDSFDMGEAFDGSDEETQDAIWKYIQRLTMLSVLKKTMTPDLMGSIGAVAQSCVDKIRDGTMSDEEAKSPYAIMQQIAQNPELMKAINDSQNM